MTRTSQWEPITDYTVLWTERILKTYVRKLMQENVATSTSQNQITMNIFSLKRLMGRTHCTVHVWMFCSWRILKSHRVTLGNRVDSFHSLSLEPSIWSTCESKARTLKTFSISWEITWASPEQPSNSTWTDSSVQQSLLNTHAISTIQSPTNTWTYSIT